MYLISDSKTFKQNHGSKVKAGVWCGVGEQRVVQGVEEEGAGVQGQGRYAGLGAPHPLIWPATIVHHTQCLIALDTLHLSSSQLQPTTSVVHFSEIMVDVVLSSVRCCCVFLYCPQIT